MKSKTMTILLALTLIVSSSPLMASAAYTPPTSYGAPQNVGVVFNIDEDYTEENGRWSFDIGFSASDETRALAEAYADGRFEAAGFDSLHIDIQGDYKLDDGRWRSELPGYEEWVFVQNSEFDAETGVWVGNCHIYDDYFNETLSNLPGGKSYFDNHTMNFRVRFKVCFYIEGGEDYEYYSPWSAETSYSNNKKIEDPALLINHAPKLLTVELKKDSYGNPYLDFRADRAHNDIQLLNSISSQRVFTNIWVKVNGGQWMDTGSYMWMKEQFTVNAEDYFDDIQSYEAAVYEAKFRYSLEYVYYPVAGKSGSVYSPFSNTIAHGMPAYQGASSWAINELDQASELGLITDKIKGKINDPITREEFAEIAVRFYEMVTGNTATPHPTKTFKDTSNPEVLKALNLKITAGVGDGTNFEPYSTLIRQQMAQMIKQTLIACYPDIEFDISGQADFKDQKEFANYAINPAKFMAKYGITVGDGKGSFFPNDKCTREQAVAFLIRSFNNKSKY